MKTSVLINTFGNELFRLDDKGFIIILLNIRSLSDSIIISEGYRGI